MKISIASLAIASVFFTACGSNVPANDSNVKAASVGGVYLVAQCISKNPELGGHSTLSLSVKLGQNLKAASLQAPKLEFAPALSGNVSSASVSSTKISINTTNGKIDTRDGVRTLNSVSFDIPGKRVIAGFLVPGTTDVHDGGTVFTNCNFSNLSLIK